MKVSMNSGGIVNRLGIECGYAAFREAGFEGVDWSIHRALPPDQIRALNHHGSIFEAPIPEIQAFFTQEVETIRKNGLSIVQAHAPYPAYIPGHPELLPQMIDIYKKCIHLCQWAGCPNLVIHGISLPREEEKDTFADIEALNLKLFRSLIPTLLTCSDVTVCLENLTVNQHPWMEGFCSDPYDAVRYVDLLNAEAGREVFGLCMDSGHLQVLRRDIRFWISIAGKRIRCLHLHDNDTQTDLHHLPLTGMVSWDHIVTGLGKAGYQGDLNFETFTMVKAKENLPLLQIKAGMEMTAQIGAVLREQLAEISEGKEDK